MLAAERRKLILDKLHQEKHVVVSDLSRRFNVSEETIRRDLDRFEREGLVSKSYGGAVLKENVSFEMPFDVRKRKNVLGKRIIGEIIAEEIQDGDHIFMDPSTTSLFVIKALKSAGKKDLTIITNSLEMLMECAGYSEWDVISTGGAIQSEKFALVGPGAIQGINSFHVDKTIMSCSGVDIRKGLTDSNASISHVKQNMLENTEMGILAADYTKFDQVCFSRVCDLSDLDMVVTDVAPDDSWLTCLKDKGVQCLYGEEEQRYSFCQ
ncbi:MAG: DeoR/GlpR family DNA-binding transcription regulator [Clostridiales bacterium]|nr:DeoR/GlpR family DNA-binding transcription regulator [Clostridiales bacterium]